MLSERLGLDKKAHLLHTMCSSQNEVRGDEGGATDEALVRLAGD